MGPPLNLDEDAVIAAADLVGRAGARELEVGYLHEGVPVAEAGWYAHAQYRGARIIVEEQPGPVEAVDALARRLLDGAQCQHCGGLVALSDAGAMAYPGSIRPDGTRWTEEEIRAAGQCRWRRMGPKWVRGCEERQPTPHVPLRRGPNRAERRRRGRGGR